MSEFELKPCPFCGGEARAYKSEIVLPGYTVLCKKCNATVNYFLTNEEAIEAWNRRVET